jgi:hypothetical protein
LGFIWWKLENRGKIVLFLIWFLRSFKYGLEEKLELVWYEVYGEGFGDDFGTQSPRMRDLKMRIK